MRSKFIIIFFLVTIKLFSQDYKLISDLPYTIPLESYKQKLDIYIPQKDYKPAMPCLVWIHGGAWMFGSKDGLAKEIDTLLHHGYVVASIGYRLSSEDEFPAQIRDCKMAIQFLKTNARRYQIDSSKIAVAGASAGGHLAALLGTSAYVPEFERQSLGLKRPSTSVKAVIDFYGPTDFLIMDELPGDCKDAMQHSNPNSPESRLLGCNIKDCTDKARKANPITYIDKNDPPFLIIHGKKDCTVTPQSSILLKKELKKSKVSAGLILIPGAGHGGDEFYSAEIKTKVLKFLDKVLKDDKVR